MLPLFLAALARSLYVCRLVSRPGLALTLVCLWLMHGTVYYATIVVLYVMLGSLPIEMMPFLHWWSTLLRVQILCALGIVLVYHPRRGWLSRL